MTVGGDVEGRVRTKLGRPDTYRMATEYTSCAIPKTRTRKPTSERKKVLGMIVGDGFFIYDCFDCNSAVVEC